MVGETIVSTNLWMKFANTVLWENGLVRSCLRDGFDHHKLSSLHLAEQLTILNVVYDQFLGSSSAGNEQWMR
jgi:hypothetical protein